MCRGTLSGFMIDLKLIWVEMRERYFQEVIQLCNSPGLETPILEVNRNIK